MRLLDQVKLHQYTIHSAIAEMWNVLRKGGFVDLSKAIPVEITNVYRWAEEEWFKGLPTMPQEKVQRQLELFKDLRPSFHSTWFEWRMNQIRGEPGNQLKVDGRAVWAIENGPLCWTMILFERSEEGIIATHIWGMDTADFKPDRFSVIFPGYETDDGIETAKRFLPSVFIPVLLAQTLMHCKNIVVEQENISPERIKSFIKKNAVRPTHFRTIVIELMKRVIRKAGGVKQIGVERAMSIVRGNFATYTEEAPLFGQTTGRFFRPMHTRGKAEHGFKEPSYKVNPPKGDRQ